MHAYTLKLAWKKSTLGKIGKHQLKLGARGYHLLHFDEELRQCILVFAAIQLHIYVIFFYKIRL